MGCSEQVRSGSRPPDVLLLTVDTLRADYVTPERTPAIWALMNSGVTFTRATTPFPRTTPALASLFTGLRPEHHGSREVGQPRSAGRTLAERLHALGYATVGLTANPVSGRRQNLHSGFEVFVERSGMDSERADALTDLALERVRDIPPERPLFLWVHYMDPHWFYDPPRGYGPEAPGCRRLIQAVRARKIPSGRLYADVGGVASKVAAECRALYGAEIAFVDAQLRRLLAGLETLGRRERAVVVFTTDHGESLGEESLWYEHGPHLDESVVHVPLAIAAPGLPRGGQDDGVARLEDVMPTVMDLVGHTTERVDGESLLPRVRGEGPGPTLAFAESGNALHMGYVAALRAGPWEGPYCIHGPRFSLCGPPGQRPKLHDRLHDPELRVDVSAAHPKVRARLLEARRRWRPLAARQRMVCDGRFKLVARPQLEGGYALSLYDLQADPRGQAEVRKALPEVRSRLEEALDRYVRGLGAPQVARPERGGAVDPQTAADLRALGYTE